MVGGSLDCVLSSFMRPKQRARWRLGDAGEATGVLAAMRDAGLSGAACPPGVSDDEVAHALDDVAKA